jgi:hypothetical protein
MSSGRHGASAGVGAGLGVGDASRDDHGIAPSDGVAVGALATSPLGDPQAARRTEARATASGLRTTSR